MRVRVRVLLAWWTFVVKASQDAGPWHVCVGRRMHAARSMLAVLLVVRRVVRRRALLQALRGRHVWCRVPSLWQCACTSGSKGSSALVH